MARLMCDLFTPGQFSRAKLPARRQSGFRRGEEEHLARNDLGDVAIDWAGVNMCGSTPNLIHISIHTASTTYALRTLQ